MLQDEELDIKHDIKYVLYQNKVLLYMLAVIEDI